MGFKHQIEITVCSSDDVVRRGNPVGFAMAQCSAEVSVLTFYQLLLEAIDHADWDLKNQLECLADCLSYPLLGSIINQLKSHHLPVYGWTGNEEISLQLDGQSSRASYNEFALQPVRDCETCFSDALAVFLEGEIGTTLYGFKGGEYTLELNTYLHVGEYGDSGWCVSSVKVLEDKILLELSASF